MAEASEKQLSKPEPFKVREYKGYQILAGAEIEYFPGFQCREDDVWVCSFPRSGTTLTQQITYLITTLDFEKARTVPLDDRFPLADLVEPNFPYFRGIKHLDTLPETSPRMIKSHLPYCLLPEQLKSGKGKVIYVLRDPKASVVSLYKVLCYMSQPPTPTVGYYAERLLEGNTGAPWDKHFKSYWDHKDDENVLLIQFKHLVEDRRGIIQQIAEFLGKDLSPEHLDKIGEETSLDAMKNNSAVNLLYFEETFQTDKAHGGYINKGDNASWRRELSENLIQRLDNMIQDATINTDITFD